ncbi:hypothetical protein CL616_04390, partial [archaeon]|nr:hypothetical protein [archaeon]
ITFKINGEVGTNKKLYQPVFSDDPVSTVEDMMAAENKDDDGNSLGNFFTLKVGSKEYHLSVWCSKVIPPENTAEYEDFKNKVGEDNIYRWDLKCGDRAFPSMDVLSANRINMFEVGLFKPNATRWDSSYMYQKLCVQILETGDDPAGRDKTKTNDDKFEHALRNLVKKIIMDIYKNDQLIAKEVKICKSILSRMKGLMFKTKITPILLQQVRESVIAIHMFFVFRRIDAIWLNKNKEIVEIKRSLLPFSPLALSTTHAKYVLELPRYGAKLLQIGDRLDFLE